jgi:hypothetical protein
MYETGDSEKMQQFSDAFAKLEENFVASVCPSLFHPQGRIRFLLLGHM